MVNLKGLKGKTANLGFGTFIETILNTIYELKHLKKRKVDLEVVAKVVYPNGRIEGQKALINESENFILVPMLNRVWMVDKIHEEDGKRTVYVPYKYHKALDINKIILPTKYAMDMNVNFMRRWEKLRIDNISGSINLNLLDNEISPDFIVDAHKVLKTKSLEFLEEVPKKVWLMSMIIASLLGMVLGGIVSMLIMGFLF